MLAADPRGSAGGILTFPDVVGLLTLLVAVATLAAPFLQQFIARSRRRLDYSLDGATQILNAPSGVSSGLRVVCGDQVLENPYLYELRVVFLGRKEISTNAFDQGRPIRLRLGVPIVALLETQFTPDRLPRPKVRAVSDAIEVGPDLIRPRLEMRCAVLAEGAGADLQCENPVLGFNERRVEHQDHGVGMLQRTLGIVVASLVIVWIVSNPAASGDQVQSWITGIMTFFHHLF
jgi:hypothetical protein